VPGRIVSVTAIEKATLFPSIRRSQNSHQFGRATGKCSIFNIFPKKIADELR
jgi:hypothetical protein